MEHTERKLREKMLASEDEISLIITKLFVDHFELECYRMVMEGDAPVEAPEDDMAVLYRVCDNFQRHLKRLQEEVKVERTLKLAFCELMEEGRC